MLRFSKNHRKGQSLIIPVKMGGIIYIGGAVYSRRVSTAFVEVTRERASPYRAVGGSKFLHTMLLLHKDYWPENYNKLVDDFVKYKGESSKL